MAGAPGGIPYKRARNGPRRAEKNEAETDRVDRPRWPAAAPERMFAPTEAN